MSNYKRYFEQNFPVFITMVSYNRQHIFIDNIDVLRNAFRNVKQYYKFDIISIVILKDHLHFIISAENSSKIPQIIRIIKVYFTKNCTIQNKPKLTNSLIKQGEKGIWQRRYYDHIIRHEPDLWKHVDYIHYNSVKHYNISPKDWNYSSFHKFVKNNYYEINWCNVDDKYNIKELNLE